MSKRPQSGNGLTVTLVVPGPVGSLMNGPAMRGWELARHVVPHHSVTVLARVTEASVQDGISVLPGWRRQILKSARVADVVIAPWVPPYLYASLLDTPTKLISDLYDPAELELSAGGDDAAVRAAIQRIRRLTMLQLGSADLILCGGLRQRERLLEECATLQLPQGEPPVEIMPFGLDAPPDRRGNAIRDRFPAIGDDDLIVLWWGSMWKWLDASGALQAFSQLLRTNPGVKLVFSAGQPPAAETVALAETENVRAAADALELTGRSVFFIDEWIPYDERSRWLTDADIGITLHRDPNEAHMALRARYLDLLWCSIPCVLSAGDELAETFAEAGFAALVPIGDTGAVVGALASLLDARHRGRAVAAGERLAATMRWEQALTGPRRAIEDVVDGARPRRRTKATGTLKAVADYYAHAAIDAARCRKPLAPRPTDG